MSDIGLVAFDLDGTLLTTQKTIRDDAREAILELQRTGVMVTLITGRSYLATEHYARELQLLTPFGLVHGAWVRDLIGLEILKRAIPPAGVKEALRQAAELGCVSMVVGMNGEGNLTLCAEDRDHPVVGMALRDGTSGNRDPRNVVDFLPRDEISISGYVAYIIGEKGPVHQFLDRHEKDPVKIYQAERYPILARDSVSLFGETHEVVMLTPVGTDKGIALEAIAESLSIPLDQTLAFGDWHNDVGMLDTAGTAVIMGNTPAEVVARVRNANVYRTATNDEAGICQALERFNLI